MNSAAFPAWRHIAVEGAIGAGKSTLARRLAQALGARLLLERAEDNPFLERFYADMPGYAFQVQLSFLFQRLKQVRQLAQPGMFDATVVSDFMLAKDALFAKLNLSDEEHRLYATMYAQVASQARAPDLVIWLQASPTTLLARVRRRAIFMEQAIDEGYLQGLCDAYAEFFLADDTTPLLVVGTENFNPGECDADFALLLQQLAAFRGRRMFLNADVDLPLA